MISKTIGFAMSGSYCTFEAAVAALEVICSLYEKVIPIMSENSIDTDTRFGTAEGFIKRVESLCNHKIINTIKAAEPIGPQGLFDLLVIAPCTGNTLAKLSHGITDTCVTMAAKAHLRNERPLLIAISTNDGLSAGAENIGRMLVRKNVYFLPFYQDDPINKPSSLIANLNLLPECIETALSGRQLQPILSGTPS